MTVSILAGFLAFTCLVSRINGQCTQDAVDECAKKLSDSTHEVNAAAIPFLNERDAREHCEHYKYFENCLRPIKPHCLAANRLNFEGTEKAYKWWCEDLFDVYLNHNQCFQNVELHKMADVCVSNYNNATEKAINLQGEGKYSDSIDTYCRGSLSYLDCIEADVTDHCNDSTAGHWQRGMDERQLSSFLEYLGCVVEGYWIMADRREKFPSISVYQFPHEDGSDRTTLRSISEEVYDPSQCSSQTLGHCMLELADAGHDVNEAVVPFLTEDEAREHCRLYYKFEICWEPAKENCSSADKRNFAATELVYEWWCKDLFDEYLEHQPCLNNKDLHLGGDYCKANIDIGIASASSDYQKDGDEESYNKRLCQYIQQYLNCVENVVKRHCEDVDAAKWQRGFDERSFLPLADHIGCVANNKWVADGSSFPSVTVDYFNDQKAVTVDYFNDKKAVTVDYSRDQATVTFDYSRDQATVAADYSSHQKGSDHIVIIAAVLCVLCVLVIVVASTTIYLRKRKLNMTNARPSIMNEAPQPYAVYENAQDNAHVYLGIDPFTESTDDNNAKEYVLTKQGHSDTNGNVPSRPEGGEGCNYQKF